MKLDFNCVQVEMNILSKSNQLTQRLIDTFLDMSIAHSKRDTSIGRSLLHGTWKNSSDIFRVGLIVIHNLWSIHDVSLTIIEFEQEDSC